MAPGALRRVPTDMTRVVFVAGLLAVAACSGTVDNLAPTVREPDPSAVRTPSGSLSRAGWEPPAALRPASSQVVRPDTDTWENGEEWPDGRDAGVAEIDFRWISALRDTGGARWGLRLAARSARDPAGRTLTYGVVVDSNGDHRADCQIGINNDGPRPGDFHLWITNVRTRETTVRDGPPYGMPVEFSHPAERTPADGPPVVGFSFLTPYPGPCDRFGRAPTFYAFSTLTVDGEVRARDYAPDAAWLLIQTKDR